MSDEEKLENFNRIISDLGILDVSLVQNSEYELSFSDQEIENTVEYAVLQNLTTLRNRVNELGVSEPIVQREGEKRISVQLPGIQDTAEAKKIIGKTANLEFRLEAKNNSLASRVETFSISWLKYKIRKIIISEIEF